MFRTLKLLDLELERLLSRLDYNHLLAVADHGFYGSNKALLLFNWLRKNGLLELGFQEYASRFIRLLYDSSRVARWLIPKTVRFTKNLEFCPAERGIWWGKIRG